MTALAVAERRTDGTQDALFQDVTGGTAPDDIAAIRCHFEALARESSWGAVALAVRVPKVTLWRFCKQGYVPRGTDVRRALGLPVDPVVLADPRICDCGCRTAFVPSVWNQRRIPGHPRRRR